MCSTGYGVRRFGRHPTRAHVEAASTEQNGLAPRPAARQGASRARNCAAKSVFSFDGSTPIFFLARQQENGGGKPSIFIDTPGRSVGPPRSSAPTGATRGVLSRGTPYLGHGLRRPNSVPKFGASVRSSAPTEGLPKSLQWADVGIGPYGKPDQPPKPAGAQRSVRARGREGWARIGAEAIKKGHSPATTQAALSEAESAGIIAGQIRFLPDAPRVQHGVQGSEVCGKPRPCSRRDCVN